MNSCARTVRTLGVAPPYLSCNGSNVSVTCLEKFGISKVESKLGGMILSEIEKFDSQQK